MTDYIQVSMNEVERCLNLFRYLGFSHVGKPTDREFEEHLVGNRKVIAIRGNMACELGGIEFYDDPSGDKAVGDIVIKGRKFRWRQRLLDFGGYPIDKRIINAISQDGFYSGWPIGVITDDTERQNQLRLLGEARQDKFCKVVENQSNELRVYDPSPELPLYSPETLERRN